MIVVIRCGGVHTGTGLQHSMGISGGGWVGGPEWAMSVSGVCVLLVGTKNMLRG